MEMLTMAHPIVQVGMDSMETLDSLAAIKAGGNYWQQHFLEDNGFTIKPNQIYGKNRL